MRTLLVASMVAMAALVLPASAEGTYDTGASDSEIKIGQTIGYSAAGGAIAIFGQVQKGYFDRINAAGGINGRKITLISYDDNYTPTKTVEMVRRLVEQDGVLAISGSQGTATNTAVQPYLESKKVPQLFLLGGLGADPVKHPTTTTAALANIVEGRVIGKYLSDKLAGKKIAVLFQNDDFGKEAYKGIKESLGDKADSIVAEVPFDRSSPTVDAEVSQLAASKAEVFVIMAVGKHAAQAIRRAGQLGWKAQMVLNYAAATAVDEMSADEKAFAKDALSPTFYKNPASHEFDNDAGMKEYKEFIAKWVPEASPTNPYGVNAYIAGAMLETALRAAGDDLTRENLVKQATNIEDLTLPILPEGVTINVTPENFNIFHSGRMLKFDGTEWRLLDDRISVE